MESINALLKIDDPREILNQTSERGELIYQKYDDMISRYEELLESVEVPDEKLLVFTYQDSESSYTSDLANEILYRHPDKVIIVGRIDKGLVKCSLRSSELNIKDIVNDCIQRVRGSGGGHPNACGAAIAVDDFEKFVQCFKRKL